MYDAYLVGVAGGNFVGAVPINQCSPAPRVPDPRLQIRNAGVPVIRIMSQSDYLLGSPARREDGNTQADRFRHYEMAGAAHATPDELYFSAAPADIVKAGRAVPPASCNEGPRSRFPSSIHFDAALQNLDLWVRHKLPPPPGTQIATTGTPPSAPVLDRFGNVTGGLRSPFVDVPTSTWSGSSTGASFCFIAGHETPLPQATIDALYPTHGAYVRAVTHDVARLVGKRYLTAPDGLKLIVDAAKADVP
jgi:alpha/beta hydrolase family protein